MAIYRSVHISFWTDNKVEDEFTPEDKYFYMYLLTNPQTNICGCYEISFNQMERQTGYNKETLIRLLDRFEKIHNVIRYNKDTKEILLINWYKYNWSKSEKTLVGVEKTANYIKCNEFKKYIADIVSCIRNDTPIMGHICPIQASVSDTDIYNNIKPIPDIKEKEVNKAKDTERKETIKKIINYLNNKCGTMYRPTTVKTVGYINARLDEEYTEEDFYTVIDKKTEEWIGTEWEKFLRPETLFCQKNFEAYLNQRINKHTYHNKTAEMLENSYDMMSNWAEKKKMEDRQNGN